MVAMRNSKSMESSEKHMKLFPPNSSVDGLSPNSLKLAVFVAGTLILFHILKIKYIFLVNYVMYLNTVIKILTKFFIGAISLSFLCLRLLASTFT